MSYYRVSGFKPMSHGLSDDPFGFGQQADGQATVNPTETRNLNALLGIPTFNGSANQRSQIRARNANALLEIPTFNESAFQRSQTGARNGNKMEIPTFNESAYQRSQMGARNGNMLQEIPTFNESANHRSQMFTPKIEIGTYCPFCASNGERPVVSRSHALRDRKGIITCPILRKYTCKTCGATGDKAHTEKYCPISPQPFPTAKPVRRNTVGKYKTTYN